MSKIEVIVRTNGKYGLVNPGDVLVVGEDIDEQGAERWVNVGIAKPANLKKKRKATPTKENTVAEIKAHLDENEVDYKSSLTKVELLALVSDAEG